MNPNQGGKTMAKGIGEVTTKVGQILQGLEDEGYSLDDTLQVGIQFLSIVKAKNEADALIQFKEKAMAEVIKKMGREIPSMKRGGFAKAFAVSPNLFNTAGN